MNLKNIILVFALIVQVRSDCDDYFECLSGFVKDYLSGNDANVEKASGSNDTDVVDVNNLSNASLGLFDLSDIGRSLSQALTDVTTLIKDEFKGVFNIDDETDVYKDLENKTEIHVRAFSFSKANEYATEDVTGTDSYIQIPEKIVNNLTKFNDELNALKVEIEKGLQAELESFISQILENDTVDWIRITEDSFETEFTTTEKPYPSFEEPIETNTEIINNIVYDWNISVTNEPNKGDSNEDSTTAEPISITVGSIITNNVTITTPTVTALKSTEELASERNSDSSVDAIDSSKEGVITTSTITTIVPNTTSPIASSTIISSTTPKTTRKDDISITITTSTVTTQATKQETASEPTEVNKINQQTHTKAPINYKLLEDVKVNEISDEDSSYYEIRDDNATDYPIIDYVDLYKDTTNEGIDYIPTLRPENEIKSDLENLIQNEGEFNNADNGYYANDTTHPASIFPWVAAIFIKNGTNNQFDYYCDGILLSERTVLTAARCLQRSNETVNADDVILFLGKRSLQNSAEGESIHKVKQITLHPNFNLQGNTAQNDLAALQLEEAAVLSEEIQPACLLEDGDSGDAVATAWGERLSLIKFVEKNQTCERDPIDNTFCATYGAAVALCPSYGGVYANLQSERWCAGGVRAGDVTQRGLCFQKTVAYTDLRAHSQWLQQIQ